MVKGFPKNRSDGHKNWLSLIVLLFLAVCLFYYVRAHWMELSQISLRRPDLLLLLFVLLFIGNFTFSVELKMLLRPLGVYLGQLESFVLTLATNFQNLISPRGGLAMRGFYLNRKHQCSLTSYFVFLSGRFLLNFLVASALGIIACGVLYLSQNIFDFALFLSFALVFVLANVPIFLPLNFRNEGKGFLMKKILTAAEGWRAIRASSATLRNVVLTNVVRILIQTFVWVVSFAAFGSQISLAEGVLLAVVTDLGLVIAFTPGGLGIQDAVVLIASHTMHIPVPYMLAAVATRRILYSAMLLLFGLPSTYLLLRKNEIRLSDENS